MKMSKQEYKDYVKKKSPSSPLGKNFCRAFLVGGVICLVGQGIGDLYKALGAQKETVSGAVSVTLVLLGVLLTGLGVYDRIAKFGGAGTLVPITGFANAMAAPAMEFRTEGIVPGLAAKMFIIVGPVIVFGVSTSVVYGVIYWLLTAM